MGTEEGTPVPEGKEDVGVSEKEKITDEGVPVGSSLMKRNVRMECCRFYFQL